MILAFSWYHTVLAVLFGFFAVILMVVILLQRGKGVGLSGAFGGAGGHTAFGAKTGDVLTWATIAAAALLLIFAIVLNFVFVPLSAPGSAGISAATNNAQVPASTDTTGGESSATPPTDAQVPPAAKTPVPAKPNGDSQPPTGGGEPPLADRSFAAGG